MTASRGARVSAWPCLANQAALSNVDCVRDQQRHARSHVWTNPRTHHGLRNGVSIEVVWNDRLPTHITGKRLARLRANPYLEAVRRETISQELDEE
jgi:hypothetical protein